MCSTVVLSCLSPLARDVGHSLSTAKYTAPLRVIAPAAARRHAAASSIGIERDERDPTLWSPAEVSAWVARIAPQLDGCIFTKGMHGAQFCALPEPQFYLRAAEQLVGADYGDSKGELGAKVYAALWTLMSDAKVRRSRKNK